MLGGHAVEDAEDDELGEECVALVSVEQCDAEGRDEPGENGNDDDADDDGHIAVGRDGGEDLAGDDAADESVAEENDDV